jgi:O-antigen/teichoic acid export membrane protein
MTASNDNDGVPFFVSGLAGFVVVGTITMLSRRNEAIDDPAYYVLGIPLMCVAILLVSYRFPHRPWRWTVSMAAGQATAMALGGSGLSLWPLALVFMTVCSIPQFVVGWVTGRIRRGREATPQAGDVAR